MMNPENVATLVQQFEAKKEDETLKLNIRDITGTIEEIAEALQITTDTIKILSLEASMLGTFQTANEIKQIIGALSSHINSINLGGNYLASKTPEELVEIFEMIQSNVTSLSLKGNYLGNKSTDELIQILRAFKNKITINLSFNEIDKKSDEDLKLLLKNIPLNIEFILDDDHRISALIEANKPARAAALSMMNAALNTNNPGTIILDYAGHDMGIFGFFTEEKKSENPEEPRSNDYAGPSCS